MKHLIQILSVRVLANSSREVSRKSMNLCVEAKQVFWPVTPSESAVGGLAPWAMGRSQMEVWGIPDLSASSLALPLARVSASARHRLTAVLSSIMRIRQN